MTTAQRPHDVATLVASKENIRPADVLVPPEITYQTHSPLAVAAASFSRSALLRPQGPSAPAPSRLGRVPPIVTPVLPPKPPTLPRMDRADRNIDKVVLGKLCFRTWYPSYYGKEVLGGDAGGHAKAGSKDAIGQLDGGGGKASKRDREQQHVLERLYVCPCCFKYSKELVPWWAHVRLCEERAYVPGRKIYTHPRGRRRVLVPQDANKGTAPRKRRRDSGLQYVEETVQDEGEWTIWEVDGEEHRVSQGPPAPSPSPPFLSLRMAQGPGAFW